MLHLECRCNRQRRDDDLAVRGSGPGGPGQAYQNILHATPALSNQQGSLPPSPRAVFAHELQKCLPARPCTYVKEYGVCVVAVSHRAGAREARCSSLSVPRTGRLGPIGGGPQRVLRFRSKPCQHASRPSGISMAMLSHPPLPLPRPRSGLHAVSLVPAHAPPGGASETPGRSAPAQRLPRRRRGKECPGKERVQWTWWSCRGISSGAPLGGRVLTLVFKWPTLQFESARGRGQLQFLALLLWDDPNTVHFNFVMVGSR